jgi:hypothetical protein
MTDKYEATKRNIENNRKDADKSRTYTGNSKIKCKGPADGEIS